MLLQEEFPPVISASFCFWNIYPKFLLTNFFGCLNRFFWFLRRSWKIWIVFVRFYCFDRCLNGRKRAGNRSETNFPTGSNLLLFHSIFFRFMRALVRNGSPDWISERNCSGSKIWGILKRMSDENSQIDCHFIRLVVLAFQENLQNLEVSWGICSVFVSECF